MTDTPTSSSPPISTPATPTVTTPPPSSPTPVAPVPAPESGKGRNRGLWLILVAVFALLIGAGIGYAATTPAKNDAQKQRDAAQAQVADLQKQLDQSTASATSATAARDKCSKAAVDASDLIDQDQNLWNDFANLMTMTPGSAEEVQQEQHMNTQADAMNAQSKVVTQELAACKAAIGS